MAPTVVARPAAPAAVPHAAPAALLPGLRAVRVRLGDELARPLLEGLAHEYRDLLGHPAEAVDAELASVPAEELDAPRGCLLVLLAGGEVVAGGAYRRAPQAGAPGRGRAVAELKRIWTAPSARRLGLGRLVVAELERRAAAAGYAELHLTTGARQHAAQALYASAGYVRGEELLPGPGLDPVVAFRKVLRRAAPGERTDVRGDLLPLPRRVQPAA
ncbi:hypothetical protein NUM3379_21200 [Kineococcus sp. NUM-3379]